MAENLRWYVVHTKPNSEWLAFGTLEMLGYQVLYLRYRKTVRHARKEEIRHVPHYSRYLFVGAYDWQGLYDVNNCPGVSTVLYARVGSPYIVPQKCIDELLQFGHEDELGRPGLVVIEAPAPHEKRRPEYKRGTVLYLTRGPFYGFPAKVLVDEGKLVRVEMQVLGRESEAVVAPDDLAPSSPGRAERPAPHNTASA